jgi:pilus assembly protein CpaD
MSNLAMSNLKINPLKKTGLNMNTSSSGRSFEMLKTKAGERAHRSTNPFGFLAIALLTTALSGCMGSKDVTSSIPADYRQRHPIALVQANDTLDVFVGRASSGLDHRQREDVQQFAREYMQNGQGPLIAYLPAGGNTPGVNTGLNSIRQTLAGGGASGRLQIAHYTPAPGAASPIKLVFAKLTAQTASQCGYEGDEIVPTRLSANSTNQSAYNFGCTYQKNLAAQIADPRDLVRPRQEGPVDVTKRLAGIERIRKDTGNDLKPSGTSLKDNVK